MVEEISFKIQINNVKDIQDFCHVCSLFSFDIDVRSLQRNLIIDAKSILGLYSLDLTQPILVVIHTEDEKTIEAFSYLMEAFEVQ